MDPLVEIANKAIADYGFRQAVLWSTEDVSVRWELSPDQAKALSGPVRDALEALPVPVEPADVPDQEKRLAALIAGALGS